MFVYLVDLVVVFGCIYAINLETHQPSSDHGLASRENIQWIAGKQTPVTRAKTSLWSD